MNERNYYNRRSDKYPDIVNLKQLREMLGSIEEGTSLPMTP